MTNSLSSYPLPKDNQSTGTLQHVLSQLSFEAEILQDTNNNNYNNNHDNTGSVWDGLLCTASSDDDTDLFFDAEEQQEYQEQEQQQQREKTQSSSAIDSSIENYSDVSGGGEEARLNLTKQEADDGNRAASTEQDKISITRKMQHMNNDGPILTENPTEAPAAAGINEQPHGGTTTNNTTTDLPETMVPLPGPPPPEDLPLRFLRAGKGDPVEGQRRYEATLKWRKEEGIDHILTDAHPNFDLIKKNYPHYFHLRGKNGEPVFFEQPPKTNLQAMRDGGVTLEALLHHYAMVTEFQWQCVETDDMARSITIIDLDGMGMKDFVGECIDYVRRCSEFTGQHYPERAGFVFVINVPFFFSVIWKVVKPWVDEVTLQKINILRGKKEISDALKEKIPIENIPPQYGGSSVPLGESPEEQFLRSRIEHNNALAKGDYSCGGRAASCPFCSFVPVRSY